MSKCFRYDVLDAGIGYHIKKHPQEDMRSLGFVLLNSEPCSIADCWFFEVDDEDSNYPKQIPGYLKEIDSNYFKREYRGKVTNVERDIVTRSINDPETGFCTIQGCVTVTPLKEDGTPDFSQTKVVSNVFSCKKNGSD